MSKEYIIRNKDVISELKYIKNQSIDQVQNISPVDISVNMWY